jgi:hypothetical protein
MHGGAGGAWCLTTSLCLRSPEALTIYSSALENTSEVCTYYTCLAAQPLQLCSFRHLFRTLWSSRIANLTILCMVPQLTQGLLFELRVITASSLVNVKCLEIQQWLAGGRKESAPVFLFILRGAVQVQSVRSLRCHLWCIQSLLGVCSSVPEDGGSC